MRRRDAPAHKLMRACRNDPVRFLEAVDGYTARELAEERGGTRGSWQGMISRCRNKPASRGGHAAALEEKRAFCARCRLWSGKAATSLADPSCFHCGELMSRKELVLVPDAAIIEATMKPEKP